MTCLNCGKQSLEDDAFCGKCGQPVSTSPANLREIVRAELQSELAAKYKDQKLLAIETAESIVERLEKWSKWFLGATGISAALLLATLTTIGIGTYREAIQKIDAAVTNGEQRINAANQNIDTAVRDANSAKQKAAEAIKNAGAVKAATDSAQRAAATANSISSRLRDQSSGLRKQFEQVRQNIASLQRDVTTVQQQNLFENRLKYGEDVISITTLNQAIAQSFQNNDLKEVVAFLRAMDMALADNATRESIEDAIRTLMIRLSEDPSIRKKAYAAAKTVRLVK
jgi:hypothetical protein